MNSDEKSYWLSGLLFMIYTLLGVIFVIDWAWPLGVFYCFLGGMGFAWHLFNLVEVT